MNDTYMGVTAAEIRTEDGLVCIDLSNPHTRHITRLRLEPDAAIDLALTLLEHAEEIPTP